MSNYQKLKTCPCCGARASIFMYERHWVLQCSNPGCISLILPPMLTRTAGRTLVVERWNNRPMEEKLIQVILSLVASIKDNQELSELILTAKSVVEEAQSFQWVSVDKEEI